ncbi:MAG TPA: hypothetical protein DCQ64_33400 [Candidatus Rokubacteria bacterium]|nr:hypothetical protein [Candidatus Rokubacteria bacterium]
MVYGIRYPRGFSNEFQVVAFEDTGALVAAGYRQITRDQARKLVAPRYFAGGPQDHRTYGNVAPRGAGWGDDLAGMIDDPECIPLPAGAPRRVVLV